MARDLLYIRRIKNYYFFEVKLEPEEREIEKTELRIFTIEFKQVNQQEE